MLDKLLSLFHINPMQSVTAIVKAVGDVAGFLEQHFGADKEKFNGAIDNIKEILDQHKKV